MLVDFREMRVRKGLSGVIQRLEPLHQETEKIPVLGYSVCMRTVGPPIACEPLS